MPKKEWDDARPQGAVPLLSKGCPSRAALFYPGRTRGWMKVGPDTSVGANQDFNSQTPAPARLARNPAERTGAREDAVLDVLPPGLHSTGGTVGWI